MYPQTKYPQLWTHEDYRTVIRYQRQLQEEQRQYQQHMEKKRSTKYTEKQAKSILSGAVARAKAQRSLRAARDLAAEDAAMLAAVKSVEANRYYRGRSMMPVRPELNVLDAYLAWANIGTLSSATPTLINAVSQGTAQTQHISNQYKIKSLQGKMQFTLQAASAADAMQNGVTFRYAIIHDLSPNGVLPPIGAIYASAGAGTSGILAFRNPNTTNRFRSLKDESITVQLSQPYTGAAPGGASETKYVEFYLPLNIDVKCGGTGATIADITNGALYLIMWTGAWDTPVYPAGYTTDINANLRLRFCE